MTKKVHRKPAAFHVEDVEVFTPPLAPETPPEPAPVPVRVRALPDLGRGLKWGSIFLGALGGLVGLLASIWLYDYVLALIAREDWIGWVAAGLLGLVLFALVMIVLREAAGLARLGRLGKIRHEADSAAHQNEKALAV
ncbi:MAG: TIGR01620 family protein, partial [Methyloceanibacter sp.]